MGGSTNPRRVVMVDADNPLEEIHGEFFWREDHDRLMEAARAEEFERGYAAGLREAGKQHGHPIVVRLRRHRSPVRVVWWLLLALVVVAYCVDLLNG